MARRTKEQIRLDNLINSTAQSSLSGYHINITDMHFLSEAGEAAAKDGKSDDEIKAAIFEARDKHAKKA